MGQSQCEIGAPKIYVVCPGGAITGGPELLHQLVHTLRQEGREAFISYYPFLHRWTTPEPYRRYECPVAASIPDNSDVAVLVPETLTRLLFRFRLARHVIWWLSVDHYLGVRDSVGGWVRRLRRPFFTDIPSPRSTTHLFQSAYARNFVQAQFNVCGAMLSDYISPDFLEPIALRERRNLVAFNPRKGFSFIQHLMRTAPDLECVPLQGMTRLQMRDKLDMCKVYVDFGPHPGKDRIPREAALRGLVTLFARRGSATNAEDVPVDEWYKIALGPDAIKQLEGRVRSVFMNYPYHRDAQESYREAIRCEAELFRAQVRRVFNGNMMGA